MAYKAPKAIVNHPGVETCEYAPESGVDDYRHDVWLREGWCWKNGRNAGGRTGHFNTVAEFRYANPIKGA